MKLTVFFLFLVASANATSSNPNSTKTAKSIEAPCGGVDYIQKSKALRDLFTQDQKDRENFTHWTKEQAIAVTKRDRVRRKKVAELFALGCLKSADDYFFAATVFQHGEVPDHFFQTYLWSLRAFQMGKTEAGIMAANGIDRYLMNLGLW